MRPRGCSASTTSPSVVGRNWGTILIDAQTSTPIDLLPDRTAEDLETWLAAREGIEVICHDRAGTYAEGANRAAPEAIQVADRWHLLHNLNTATERVIRANRTDLAEAPTPTPVPEPEPQPEHKKVAACRDRYLKVKALHDLGLNITQISERLGLNRTTVRKYAHPDFDPASIGGKYPGRRSNLTEYEDYLRARFHEGCHNAAKLHAEVVERGYRGVARSVRRFIVELRLGEPKQRAEPGPSVREATTWITSHPANLTPGQAAELDKICDRSPVLRATRELVAGFTQMLVERRGWELETWIKAAQASGIAPIASFANGPYKDNEYGQPGIC